MLGPLNAANHPLSECTADEITDFIIENLKPGEKLPNESELCQVMCVSRTTVREAIKILASRNIVTIVRGVGTFVSEKPGISDDPLGFKFVQDKSRLSSELLQLRMFIEPPLVRLAATHATDDELNMLDKMEQNMEKAYAQGKDISKLDLDFHSTISKASHNHVVGLIFPIFAQEITSDTIPTEEKYVTEIFANYRNLIKALKKRDSQKAYVIILYLLEKNMEYIKSKI